MRPLIYVWDGDAMQPLDRFAKLCDQQFVVGEQYLMDVMAERSARSHNHYFAALSDLWHNLPETIAPEFPDVESLRKRALVEAGYYDERRIIANTPQQAMAIIALATELNEYAVATLFDCVVVIRTPKSQSKAAMGGKQFQESKQKVLDAIATMIEAAHSARRPSPSIAPSQNTAKQERKPKYGLGDIIRAG